MGELTSRPDGNGPESGRWGTGSAGANVVVDSPSANPPRAIDIQVADAAGNWARYLATLGAANAAERTGAPFNGLGPNTQHERAVREAMDNFRSNGLTIVQKNIPSTFRVFRHLEFTILLL